MARVIPKKRVRYLAPDIERAATLVQTGALSAALRGVGGPALWVPA